jgi:16S rRNA processing protein RimM
VRVRLADLADRDAAQEWTGALLSIPESALRPLPEGEFYWRELLGARCRDRTGAELGLVDEIWPTRAHDVLVLRDGSVTRLLAVRTGTLVHLDRAGRVLTVDWPGEPEDGS